MAKKASHRDILIEQCLQDAKYERLDEGWWDDVKANVRGAGEWLKQDAKDSFRLRKKGDIKTKRTDAKQSGKVKSYANSLAKTMSDYKKNGGTLGQDIENIDDAINRLTQVANGQPPRGRYRNNSNVQSQHSPKNIVQSQPVQTPASNTSQAYPSSIAKPANTIKQTSTNISNSSAINSNSPAQSAMLDTINKSDEQNSNDEANVQTSSNNKSKFDRKVVKDRAKNIKNIRKQRDKEAAAADKAEKVKKNGTLGQKISKGVSNVKNSIVNGASDALDKGIKGVKKTYKNLKDRFGKPTVYDAEVVENEPETTSPEVNGELGPVNPNVRPVRRAKGRVVRNPKSDNTIDAEIVDNQPKALPAPKNTQLLGYTPDENTALPQPKQELALVGNKGRTPKALPGSGTYVGEFGNDMSGTSYTGSTHSQTDKGDAYIGDFQNIPNDRPSLVNQQKLLGYTPDEQPKTTSKKKKKDPLAGLRSNIDPSKLAKGRKLKTGPKPTKRKRILTAKNALDNERSQENMRKLVDTNPDAFMYDSYNPYENSQGQLKMLDTF